MVYSNYDFLLLLPPLVAWFYTLRSAFAQNLLLLFVGVVFLAWTSSWNLAPVFLVLVIGYWWFSLDRSKRLGWSGMALVIGFLVLQLAYLKYRVFIGETFGVMLPAPAALAALVPLGISFYTFEAISAIMDVHRRKLRVPAMRWALFIMFLPHLIAGPIVRWRLLAPQFGTAKRFRWRNLSVGLHFFTIGFLKKLAADPLGRIIDPVWSSPRHAGRGALLVALLGFYTQLYLDFSGYTDMGRGIARMLGFRLPLNFRAPFFSKNPSEFYQRWHVSLSSWIRTFVYDTLAVKVFRRFHGRRAQNRALFAVVLLVMAIFGLWHGSAWHFVLFGISQGFVIAGWMAVTKGRSPRHWFGRLVSLLILQATWLASLILFRASSLSAVWQFLLGLQQHVELDNAALRWCLLALFVTALVQAVDFYVHRRRVATSLRFVRGTVAGAILVSIAFVGALALKIAIDARQIADAGARTDAGNSGFIYFRF
jgi:D-alanyl-lipoteichoic acid acyltransferase DltB (MBOAT superfamily)